MHPALIKAALKMAGSSQTDIARERGVTHTTVGSVIFGKGRSAPIEQRISEITGLPLAELWPQWHGPDAKPSRRRALPNAHSAAPRKAALPMLKARPAGEVACLAWLHPGEVILDSSAYAALREHGVQFHLSQCACAIANPPRVCGCPDSGVPNDAS